MMTVLYFFAAGAVPILLIALFLVYELHLRLRIERRMNP